MDETSLDSETLVALVASLLETETDAATILNALAESDGDVHSAAKFLNSNVRLGSKRKRPITIEDWLKASKVSATTEAEDAPAISKTRPRDSSNTVNLMSVLRQETKKAAMPPRLRPMTLSNIQLVAQHTPCTLHTSVLPNTLATTLFYTMLDLSRQWKRNKWYLFDRIVESPHRTCFYARSTAEGNWEEAARFWYNGRMTDIPSTFPAPMEEACKIIERVVNEEISKRTRFPLEWAGKGGSDLIWEANVAAANCYEGSKESVGFHSDQMTYLGPYCTIASLSLGTCRNFALREVIPQHEKETRSAQTFNIPLPHNSLIVMHASCQERFKHSIPPQSAIDLFRPAFSSTPGGLIEPSNCRINITFRFYRPDFHPSTIPRCDCGTPTILRADMKNRMDGKTDRYWWSCYAGAQNEGKGCNFWKLLDMKAEGRGPIIESLKSTEMSRCD